MLRELLRGQRGVALVAEEADLGWQALSCNDAGIWTISIPF